MFIKNILKLSLLLYVFVFSQSVSALDIIANSSVKANTLTTSQIRRIYSMRQVLWREGFPIIVYVLPSKHKLHQEFSKKILRMFPYQLDRIWNKLTYSGVGVAPIEVDSPQALIDAVMTTPGAIGYAELSDNNHNLHIIKIKG